MRCFVPLPSSADEAEPVAPVFQAEDIFEDELTAEFSDLARDATDAKCVALTLTSSYQLPLPVATSSISSRPAHF